MHNISKSVQQQQYVCAFIPLGTHSICAASTSDSVACQSLNIAPRFAASFMLPPKGSSSSCVSAFSHSSSMRIPIQCLAPKEDPASLNIRSVVSLSTSHHSPSSILLELLYDSTQAVHTHTHTVALFIGLHSSVGKLLVPGWTVRGSNADPSGRAVKGEGLRPIACWG